MALRHERFWIIDPITCAVRFGFFAVRFGKNAFEHGIEVKKVSGAYAIYLNGQLIGHDAYVSDAFGPINIENGLAGRQVCKAEYLALSKVRLNESFDGLGKTHGDIHNTKPIF